jgi:hypothetical protein
MKRRKTLDDEDVETVAAEPLTKRTRSSANGIVVSQKTHINGKNKLQNGADRNGHTNGVVNDESAEEEQERAVAVKSTPKKNQHSVNGYPSKEYYK